jgi:molybdopterin-containing oxidoreductase family iron-sulfur binding subunit
LGEDVRRESNFVVDQDVVKSIRVADPEFSGSSNDYPFILHPFMTTSMYDGRGANLPWMQELPDPMTKIVYGSWVEMNPATAKEMGVTDGDLLRVTSEQGSVEVPLVTFPAIMPDVVAMPIGQGHDEFGRYARNRGSNPIQILAPTMDAASGSLATSATRVSLAATGRRAEPISTGGVSKQLGRNIVQFTGDSSDSATHSSKLHSIPITVEPA